MKILWFSLEILRCITMQPLAEICSDQKCIRSQKHAAERGLPILKNVLLPKTKGFCTCLEELRGSLDAGCLICVCA
jgi:hypothetical protein